MTLPFSLDEYVQLACMGQHSLLIEIGGASRQGRIVVWQGDVHSAVDEHGVGEPAFVRLARRAMDGACVIECRGLRTFEEPRNVQAGIWQALLLDSARARDEAHSDTRVTSTGSHAPAGPSPRKPRDHGGSKPLTVAANGRPPQSSAFLPPPRPPASMGAARVRSDAATAATEAIAFARAAHQGRPTIGRARHGAESATDPGPRATERTAHAASFGLARERGIEALLAKDYTRALYCFQAAEELSPGDPLVRGNIERLAELGVGRAAPPPGSGQRKRGR
ncbi:MAG: DUF4388 domain-containing protein [Myxococcales bacterium FL481]|nr:MAG: DUF4388 domain-containing protein [Myxococcales bacterium FL481]